MPLLLHVNQKYDYDDDDEEHDEEVAPFPHLDKQNRSR